MRSVTAAYAAINDKLEGKSPRYVIAIHFNELVQYFTSHSDILGMPSGTLFNVLSPPRGTTQRLDFESGSATIGRLSFDLLDAGRAFTDLLHSLDSQGVALRKQKVQFYQGWRGWSWAQFQAEKPYATQLVDDFDVGDGEYNIRCADIQREQRVKIFTLAETTLSASITETQTTIPVYDTTGFQGLQHTSSFTDAPTTKVAYFQIESTKEIIRVPSVGIVPGQFLNCTRGALKSVAQAIEIDPATQPERRPKVKEYVYLELPLPKLAYAILTGVLHPTTNVLPDTWHLGIDPAYVRLADFIGIGNDLWQVSDNAAGLIVRFEGLEDEDGKKFLETELYLLAGLFSPVRTDGSLGLRRRSQIKPDAPAQVILSPANIISHSRLHYDQKKLFNVVRVEWNWNGDEFTRVNIFADSESINKYREAPVKTLSFKGLHGSRHTKIILDRLVAGYRDAYSAPPAELTVTVFHKFNRVENGDIVRVKHPQIRDYLEADGILARSFEAQQVSVDEQNGRVTISLFGSGGDGIIEPPTSAPTIMPAGFWTSQGSQIPGVAGGIMTGTQTIAGNASLTNAAAVRYHNGNLTIASGAVLNISANVQLRINGFFQNNGTINGIGGGQLGQSDTAGLLDVVKGLPGWVGHSYASDGIHEDGEEAKTIPAQVTEGRHSSFPFLQLDVTQTGVGAIVGLPTDLRGTSGGAGPKARVGPVLSKMGGRGGDSGAGLAIICKGMAYGAAGIIDLSGEDGQAETVYFVDGFRVFPGTGGGGGPGSFLLLLDGADSNVPVMAGSFRAFTGEVPIPGNPIPEPAGNNGPQLNLQLPGMSGWLAPERRITGADFSGSCYRIQFLPEKEVPAEDEPIPPPTQGLSSFESYHASPRNITPLTPTGTGLSGGWHYPPVSGDNWVSKKNAVDRASGTWSSGALFSGTPGTDAVTTAVTASNGLGWTRDKNQGAWNPPENTTEVTFSFFRAGTIIATRTLRVTLAQTAGTLGRVDVSHSGEPTLLEWTETAKPQLTLYVTHIQSGAKKAVELKAVQGGDDGAPGIDPVAGTISNGSHVVPCDGDGNNEDFSEATGEFEVASGTTDVTALATFAEVLETGCTGQINNSVNQFFTGPKGAYRVTAMSQTAGSYKMSATYNGVTIHKTFSLVKVSVPLSVSYSPGGNVFEQGGNGLVTTAAKTANVSGGTPTYTRLWVRVSGSTSITASTPTGASPTFSSNGSNVQHVAVFRCDATDSSDPAITRQGATFTVTIIHGTPP